MAEVKLGSWLIDNDPRQKGRRVQVIGISRKASDGREYALWKSAKRLNYIRLDRIGNSYKNGWTVAPETV